jgi:hypothetical protein
LRKKPLKIVILWITNYPVQPINSNSIDLNSLANEYRQFCGGSVHVYSFIPNFIFVLCNQYQLAHKKENQFKVRFPNPPEPPIQDRDLSNIILKLNWLVVNLFISKSPFWYVLVFLFFVFKLACVLQIQGEALFQTVVCGNYL